MLVKWWLEKRMNHLSEGIKKMIVNKCNMINKQNKNKKKRSKNVRRDRNFAVNTMDDLTAIEFKRMFRMDRDTFNELLEKITPELPIINGKMGENSSGSSISNKTKLACTLRWLAGGSYIDICFAFGVAKTTFFETNGILWTVLEAINKVYTIGYPIDDLEELEK